MKSQDCYEISKWASQVAHDYNKSITYVLMKLHEAMGQYTCIETIKTHVISQMVEVQG